MVANTDPIFSKKGNLTQNGGTTMNAAVTAAANDYTGAGANNVLIFTAGADGAYVARIRLKAIGTNVASVMRFFLNNGSTNGTSTNNQFIGEIALPATTATATGITVELEYVLDMVIPAGFKIYAGLGTAVAAGWIMTPVAGDY